jgi:death-on-curing protein
VRRARTGHAPVAGFADTDLYPDLVDKAAVLIVRLAKNHSLRDGNKRTVWVALRLFVGHESSALDG